MESVFLVNQFIEVLKCISRQEEDSNSDDIKRSTKEENEEVAYVQFDSCTCAFVRSSICK